MSITKKMLLDAKVMIRKEIKRIMNLDDKAVLMEFIKRRPNNGWSLLPPIVVPLVSIARRELLYEAIEQAIPESLLSPFMS